MSHRDHRAPTQRTQSQTTLPCSVFSALALPASVPLCGKDRKLRPMNTALKYVQLRAHTTGAITFVFGLAPFSHHDLAAAFSRTHAPISAGFIEPISTGGWRTFGSSQSLCLVPAATDAGMIGAFTRAQFQTAA